MDNFSRYGRLIAGVCFLLASGVASAQSMPSVTPISSVPQGPAPGGGVVSSVTYEIKGGSAAAGAAANESSFLTRAVTIGGPTMGGILRGATATGLRLAGWVGLAYTAYEAYKWITDSSGNLVTSPESVPATPCSGGGPFWQASWGGQGVTGCSLPGVSAALKSLVMSTLPGWSMTEWECDYESGSVVVADCYGALLDPSGVQRDPQYFYSPSFVESGAPPGTFDPAYDIPSRPVTNRELDDLVQHHPEWWPDMLRDPQTGQPLLTPEIANDIDDVKHQIAPRYGVDPKTLPQTQPDPGYVNGKAEPRETSLPAYCAWAADACAYHQWVKDHWPDNEDKKKYQDNGCDVPPECTGDTILCAEVLNTWKLKCAFSTDDAPPDTPDLQPGDVSNPEQDLGDTSSLDRSGLGWGVSCPFSDIVVPMPGDATVTLTFDPVCEYGHYMRIFILIMAGITCAGILGGFSLRGVTGGG